MAARPTIFAPATAAGRAGVAILRASGPAARDACRALTGTEPPPARQARLRDVRDREGQPVDRALLLWFDGPASLTGEDVLEVQVHGGPALIAALLDHLAAVPGLALAEPGGFARQAFLNGKLDLTAAEGLADLVEAETRAQLRQARRQLQGDLGRLYETWRGEIMSGLALAEAEIDFGADQADVGMGASRGVRSRIAGTLAAIEAHLVDRRGERLRRGLTVAIVGPPNAGKSTLLNTLAGRDVAIVTDRPGTTRDRLEVALDLGGYPLTLIDTAGLREADDSVEAIGVSRAREAAAEADVVLLLFDGASWPVLDDGTLALADERALFAVSKVDLGVGHGALRAGEHEAIAVSSRLEGGLDEVIAALQARAAAALDTGDAPLLTRARHRQALGEAAEALRRLRDAPEDLELALVAEELRLAASALGRITGRTGVEDVLDLIFGQFCIGK
ncbi:tRNA uridine-5-carboxymethylaminomethyl(34) synthesis GTPase MnmE [Marinivivus vitaminiproducens]|uniref:tRNA uridine-5-carboxymethylaminomethyl(34) synthesis GTPase MnmE n=1 Tax=Marinivivus vitaminiproducens TaxID=3035935 RepID=UPI0027A73BA7|nr:tRNA uridine-5-carboxymethylaminomethyl(34) synthesis GTPase MnmE [Geminicoccaceae bacterium SCSIO 64248]